METFIFGLKYWKRNIPGAIMIQIVSFIAIICDLAIPYLSAMFIDYIIQANEVTENAGGIFHFLLTGKYGEVQSFELFLNISLFFMAFLLTRIVLVYFKNVYLQHLGLNLETDLRVVTYKKLNELDSVTLAKYNSGELLQIINSDTIMFKEMFCRMIPNIADSIFVLVTTVLILSTENIRFIVIPIVLAPILAVALLRFRKLARKNFQEIRKCSSDMNLTVTENIEAVRIVRSFTNEELEKEKFDKSNKKFYDAHIEQIWLSSKFDVLFNVIKQVAYIGTIAIGAILVIRGHMLIGFISASASYVLKIMNHITQINNTLFQMTQQLVAGQKMYNFMNTKSAVPDDKESKLVSKKPNIEVKGEVLDIEGQRVLDNVSVSIPYGKKLGIVGPTGGGKSVFLKSLIRVQDITDGQILIDGHDIKEYSLTNLRNMYSYVFQDVFLFSNTIDSNIAYSDPDCNDVKVHEAAVTAQADNFIKKFPDGYQTIVGERGLGVSGGQKQRISIARALLKDSPVLILDDSTSALDVNTEKALLNDIRKKYPEKTLIITAHRLTSVVDCDEIIYLQEGKIAERGTFKELMEKDGLFAEVYNIQQAQSKAVVDFDALAAKIEESGVK